MPHVLAHEPGSQESLPLEKRKHRIQCDLAKEVLGASGSLWLRVFGCSMLPAVWPGDLVLIHRADFSDLHPGQLLLFHGGGESLVVHRIVAKNTEAAITRGDTLPHNDDPVPPSRVLGTVSLIQRGRAQFIPKGRLNCAQKLLSSLICRYAWLRAFLLLLNAFRLKWNHLQTEPLV